MSFKDDYKPDEDWLIDVIKLNNEHPLFDFKAEVKITDTDKDLEKEYKAELVRDIISLANRSLLEQERAFLIIGVSKGKIKGILSSFDDNIFQNLINSFIKPNVDFLYQEIELKRKKIGIFTILPRGEIIFSFSKDYKTKKQKSLLKEGNTYIREGSKKTLISDTMEKMKLQKTLDSIIQKEKHIISVSPSKRREFWIEYDKFISIWFDNLDFLGISNLKDEKPIPLEEIFIALKFTLEKNIIKNNDIKEKSIDFITEYYQDIKRSDLENDATKIESILQRIFAEIESMENSLETIKFYRKVISSFKSILFIGGPGFGKTTLLKFIAVDSVKQKFKKKQELHPFFITLQNYERFIIMKKDRGEVYSLIDYIALDLCSKEFTKNYNVEEIKYVLENKFSEKRNILLLDGLDEISNQNNRMEILKNIRLFALTYDNIITVVTSRNTVNLEYLKSGEFFPIYIKPLQISSTL